MPRPTHPIDWPSVRFDYETGTLTLDQLCVKHGIPWKTTLIRHKAKHGWRREVGEIAARLTVLEVAGVGEDGRPLGVAAVPASTPPPLNELPNGDETAAAPPVSPAAPPRSAEEHQEAQILTARAIARLHSERIKQQLAVAELIQDVGTKILRQIGAYFDAPLELENDDVKADLQRRVARLVGANPDRETLAGLLRAATDVVTRGVAMERHALGMDLAKGALPNAEQDVPYATRNTTAIQALAALDQDAAMKLRALAETIQRSRRAKIIDADPS